MPHFKLNYTPLELRLKQPFTIARGSKETVNNVFVQLESEGIEGLGEAAPNTRYDEDAGKVVEFLEALPAGFFDEIDSAESLSQKLDRQDNRVKSAQSAIEMAWLDWWGKKKGQPLWRLWDAPSNKGPVTSFTIGLDEPDVMQQKVRDAAAYPILKVKLGTDRDREIIEAIREVTDKPLRVDANEGWKTLEEAKAAVRFLAGRNIELVEQPMPAGQFKEMVKLKEYSSIPLCADESFEGEEDVTMIARAFDAVNIKLMKTGSMVKAKQIIEKAKATGLDVMTGCMIESSLANTAGAVLSLRADYADLDGHLLIADDPFEGLRLDDKKHIMLSETAGLGVKKRG